MNFFYSPWSKIFFFIKNIRSILFLWIFVQKVKFLLKSCLLLCSLYYSNPWLKDFRRKNKVWKFLGDLRWGWLIVVPFPTALAFLVFLFLHYHVLLKRVEEIWKLLENFLRSPWILLLNIITWIRYYDFIFLKSFL